MGCDCVDDSMSFDIILPTLNNELKSCCVRFYYYYHNSWIELWYKLLYDEHDALVLKLHQPQQKERLLHLLFLLR